MVASIMVDVIIVVAALAIILAVTFAVLRTNRRDAKDVWQAPERIEAEVPPAGIPRSERQDWEVLAKAATMISASAAEAGRVVDEAAEALDASHPVTTHASLVRLEMLEVKADLESELEKLVLECSACGQPVHWVSNLGEDVGHWAHLDPAPHVPVLLPVPTETTDGR